MSAPLIVTARLDPDSFAVLDGLRRRHFPPDRNIVPAHISLFHHLPGEEAEAVLATVREACGPLQPLDLEPGEARFLGRGVALSYRSPSLSALHAELAAQWRDWLTPQDRQPFRAHVTIQNKADPAEARRLHAEWRDELPPPCRIDGVDVWAYLNGPWRRLASVGFGAGASGDDRAADAP